MLIAALLAGGCGGGSGGSSSAGNGGGTGSVDGLPAQDGCTYRYTLTSSPQLTGTDPLLARQWHLANTGQSGGLAGEDVRAQAAWAVSRGEGARVAVVDDAVDILHPDLSPNAVAGASYNYRTGSVGNRWPLPCLADETHGTAVAGVVAARDGNAVAGAGVAPRVGLVGLNPLATSYAADIADALGRGLTDTGVYNSSWGSPDNGRPNRVDASFAAAIDNGITNGRGGRGAVYVFAAGNGGCISTNAGGQCVGESSGLDGYTNHLGVLVACSVDHRGRRPYYGETGANILVCGSTSDDAGRAAITTLAPQEGTRSNFGGTSAAAPMVSGAAALVLAANPTLTWRDVRLLLARTARRNDPASPDWVTSGPGLPHHPEYGFGTVDAQAAANAARGWSSVGGSASLISCGPYTRSPGQAIPDGPAGAMVEDSVTVDAAGCGITRIEHVEVAFTASHPYIGDLRIRLVSPNGLVSRLADARRCLSGCGSYSDWRFGSVRHMDEAAAGAWRLQVTDMQANDTGSVQTWGLRIWGR
jgi:subtilisin family serine protease